jgi:hypothetical protein
VLVLLVPAVGVAPARGVSSPRPRRVLQFPALEDRQSRQRDLMEQRHDLLDPPDVIGSASGAGGSGGVPLGDVMRAERSCIT